MNLYNNQRYILLYLAFLMVVSGGMLSACQREEIEINDQDAFVKVFETALSGNSIEPIDMTIFNDSTYLILGQKAPENSTFYQAYLLAVSHEGKLLWEKVLEQKYVNPLKGIYTDIDGSYFYCMDAMSLGTYKLKIDSESQELEEVAYYPDLTYPLSNTALADGGAIIQYYKRNARATAAARLGSDNNVSWKNEYPILEDVEEDIITHLIGTGKQLPFFSQQSANGDLMLNGFYNYGFALLFISATDGELQGALSGERYKSGIRHALPLGGNQYALAAFDSYQSYLEGTIEIQSNALTLITDYPLTVYPELDPALPLSIKKRENTILVLGTTHARQLALYAFDPQNGTLKASKLIGEHNPYKAVEVITTKDNGLAILASTQVAGRFKRIGMFKLSAIEVSEWLNTASAPVDTE